MKMEKGNPYIVLCVEGQTDADVMRQPIRSLFQSKFGNDVDVDVRIPTNGKRLMGDITALEEVGPENIEKMLYKYYFKSQDKASDLGWNEVTHIIHIIDIDGAFISDEDIRLYTEEEKKMADRIYGKGSSNPLYFDDHIAVSVLKNKMEERNKRKRKNIEYLLSLDRLNAKNREVGYSLYYYACNVDHFLCGEANLIGRDKMRNAANFSSKYYKGEEFAEYFRNCEFCQNENYDKSWMDLRRGCVSLGRKSNIDILVERIENSSIECWL